MVCEAHAVPARARDAPELSVPSSSGWCVKRDGAGCALGNKRPFSSLFIGMVCEATGGSAPVDPNVSFSSLFIGMVCEAPECGSATDSTLVFQFPLHRDGV